MFASMYYQLWGSLVKIVGFVILFVVLTIRSCQINHRYQRDVLLADFGKFGKSWRNADDYSRTLEHCYHRTITERDKKYIITIAHCNSLLYSAKLIWIQRFNQRFINRFLIKMHSKNFPVVQKLCTSSGAVDVLTNAHYFAI